MNQKLGTGTAGRTFALRAVCVILASLSAAYGAAAAEVTEGQLDAVRPDGQPLGACPLKHTDVQADITGFIARVTLTQQFDNPFPETIEAVYRFPMSDRAAVDSMTMKIGDRVIKGVVKEREEARQIYERAKQAGQAASLLDQERPNIFTQSVANILPGSRIDITISYVEYLDYEEGRYEFAFPMVVGPRYMPGTPSGTGTTQVPDATRISPPVTPEGTRAGHDVALALNLDAGVPIQSLKSVQHEVDTERPAPERATVKLRNLAEIPNRDFILEYEVAQDKIADAVLSHVDARGGFATLVLYPPKRVTPAQATPKEMFFVIDSSGSMSGFPIEKAKKTMRLCIEQMNPNDTFNLVSFAGGVGYCFKQPVPNTAENRTHALEYLNNLEGGGGTEMMNAIRAALDGPRDEARLRVVCFMTDGFIGNDMEILDAIRKNARQARVFSFGIGSSVNRFLIEGMAREGRGEAEVVTLESDGDAAAQRFHERIHSPVLTNISIDLGGLDLHDVYPDLKAIPDLFASKPVVIKARYTKGGQGAVTLRGHTADGPYERKIDVTLPEAPEPGHDVLAPLWARARIDELMAQDWIGAQRGQPNESVKKDIIALGLEFSLVTQYTSFVAVEEKVINEGGNMKTVDVPVEMPDGVSYEGVFGEPPAAMPGKMLSMQNVAVGGALRVRGNITADSALSEPAFETLPAPAPPVSVSPAAKGKNEEESKRDISAKIDPALRGLAGKLVNGNYESGNVKVENGWVQVFLRVNDTSETSLAALRARGVTIVAVKASSNVILARIQVGDLDNVAALDVVQRIEPPVY